LRLELTLLAGIAAREVRDTQYDAESEQDHVDRHICLLVWGRQSRVGPGI